MKTLSDTAARTLGSVITKIQQYKIVITRHLLSYIIVELKVYLIMKQVFGVLITINIDNKFKIGP